MMQALILGMAALALAGCVGEKPGQGASTSGAQDYADYCAACHGATGKGDGIAAKGLTKPPADLSALGRANGGTFPTTKVMAQIWGYAGAMGRGVMPDFGPMLAGDTMPYDGGDGIETPTPVRLVALAEYLKRLQK